MKIRLRWVKTRLKKLRSERPRLQATEVKVMKKDGRSSDENVNSDTDEGLRRH